MRTRTLLISSVSILLFVLFAVGQTVQLRAKIPFAFTVSGKVLPAGQYDFIPTANFEAIEVRGSGASTSVFLGVVTRLAGALHTTPEDAHVVFDKVGDKYTLSEIWPLDGDGYLVYSTKGKHEHAVVNVRK